MTSGPDNEGSFTADLPSFADAPADDTIGADDGWQQLSSRMIAVDAAQTVIALSPAFVALAFFDIALFSSPMIPYWILAGMGVFGAFADAMRWVFTRYRITPAYVERRTGLFVRKYRSVQRDRIRNVDTSAKLRHRLSGLRIVSVGAGQQYASMESALALDALTKADAEALREELLKRRATEAPGPAPAEAATGDDEEPDTAPDARQTTEADPDDIHVMATLNPGWLKYNLLNIWIYAIAAGAVWGLDFVLSIFNVSLVEWLLNLVGWSDLSLLGKVVVAALGLTVVGAVGMGLSFFNEYWNFELARVPGPKGTALRTRRGLFTTREVNRDDSRLRGMSLAEPVFWRWLGVTDTNVVTTGFDMWSMYTGAYILPRTHRRFAGEIAGQVLQEDPSPLEVPFDPHPAAALRRRVVWAIGIAVATAAASILLVRETPLWSWFPWVSVAVLLFGLVGAVVAYRALGHRIADEYLVVRSGMWSRTTTALRRDAVSTIVIRQSLLQQRLGLATVTGATAAGWAQYSAVDLDAAEASDFATEAAPGLLGQFIDEVSLDDVAD